MRIRSLSVVLFFAVAVCSARADVIFSGGGNVVTYHDVYEEEPGPTCADGGLAAYSLTVGCSTSDPSAGFTVTGNGNAYLGSLNVVTFQGSGAVPGSIAVVRADGELDLNQTYVLVDGLGPATVNFSFFAGPGGASDDEPYSSTCLFTFDGMSQSCEGGLGAGFETISEQVDYWVPFTLGFDVTFGALAGTFETPGQFGDVSYQVAGPGLIAFGTPEPSSALLLLPGLAGVLFAARSRAKL